MRLKSYGNISFWEFKRRTLYVKKVHSLEVIALSASGTVSVLFIAELAFFGKASFDKKAAEESNIRFRRSIYITKDIKKGELFTADNIKRIRPGFGLEPKYYNKVLGQTSSRDISFGEPLLLSDIEEHTQI